MQPAKPSTAGVLQVGPLMPALERTLTQRYRSVTLPNPSARKEFLVARGHEFLVAVTSGKSGVDGQLMDDLPNLKAVINFGAGYDGTDTTTATARRIGISNTPDVLTDCVADVAVAQLLNVCRRLPAADQFVRTGAWLAGGFPLARKVSGQRVGIVGLGRVGRAIAHRLEPFGCSISYHSRTPAEQMPYDYVPHVERLAEKCDSLIVTVTGGPATVGLISARVLELLGPRGYLVNVSRGSVVDEDALIEALETGGIAGAALDVFQDEPHVSPRLLALDNVVLSPHVGSGTVETRGAMIDLVLANLDLFLAEGRLLTPIG